MAIDGNTIVVGTFNKRSSAYAFRTSDGGATYGQVAKLTASDAVAGDQFGRSVAIDGNTIVVGSRYDDDGGSASGSAYAFRTTDGWDTHTEIKLTASDAAANVTSSACPWRPTATTSRSGPTTRTTKQARPTFSRCLLCRVPSQRSRLLHRPCRVLGHHDADAAPDDGHADRYSRRSDAVAHPGPDAITEPTTNAAAQLSAVAGAPRRGRACASPQPTSRPTPAPAPSRRGIGLALTVVVCVVASWS